jgi:4a-hydroxytetrahydrobiopterin dehydratase
LRLDEFLLNVQAFPTSSSAVESGVERNPVSKLAPEEIAARLKGLSGWQADGGELVRTFQFADFMGAMKFVNSLAGLAEAAGHHPDIDIRYNRVKLALVTHDAGGLTAKDFEFAAAADNLS